MASVFLLCHVQFLHVSIAARWIGEVAECVVSTRQIRRWSSARASIGSGETSSDLGSGFTHSACEIVILSSLHPAACESPFTPDASSSAASSTAVVEWWRIGSCSWLWSASIHVVDDGRIISRATGKSREVANVDVTCLNLRLIAVAGAAIGQRGACACVCQIAA